MTFSWDVEVNRINVGETVTLRTEWLEFAKYLAQRKYDRSRQWGVTDMKYGDQSHWMTDFHGVCGEIAFCQLCNIFPDANTTPRAGTWDCVLPDGVLVDVKTTKYENGHLIASLKKAEYYEDQAMFVLMIGEPPTFKYAGYAMSWQLLRDMNIKDLGRGPAYVLEQGELGSWLDV